jgi:glucose-6-phosphate 1-epimerase
LFTHHSSHTIHNHILILLPFFSQLSKLIFKPLSQVARFESSFAAEYLTTMNPPNGVTEVIHSQSGARCSIHEYGATVLTYQNAQGRDVLFLSRDAILDGSKPIRGGIPLVFPIFGPPSSKESTMPQHGFARNNTWSIVPHSLKDNPESAEITYELHFKDVVAGVGTHNPWADGSLDVHLFYRVEITGNSLTTELTVKNTGKASFPFQALFHTYYMVDNHAALDNTQCYVQGLDDYHASDKVTQETYTVGSDAVVVQGETDLVHSPPNGIDQAEVVIGVGGTHCVVLQCSGTVNSQSVPISVVVWNPYKEKAAAMSDFGSDQYADMICVEPGILGNPELVAGETASMTQVITTQNTTEQQ